MKKITTLQALTIIIIVLFTVSVNAQITKGNWMVGGTGFFTNSTVKTEFKNTGQTSNDSGYGLNIQPNIGYFVADKLVLGLTPSISYSKNNNNSGSGNFGYGGGPFARYYLLKTDNMVNVLTQVGYQYFLNSTTEGHTDVFVVKAGPVLYLNSSVGLELTVDYEIDKFNSQSSISTFKTFNVRIGFQIHLEK